MRGTAVYKTTLIGVYERHNASVLEHFRCSPGDLLALHVSKQGAGHKLYGFLGKACVKAACHGKIKYAAA